MHQASNYNVWQDDDSVGFCICIVRTDSALRLCLRQRDRAIDALVIQKYASKAMTGVILSTANQILDWHNSFVPSRHQPTLQYLNGVKQKSRYLVGNLPGTSTVTLTRRTFL